MTFNERQKWFIERIGKKVYRGKLGIKVLNREHAIFLHDMENTDMKVLYTDKNEKNNLYSISLN